MSLPGLAVAEAPKRQSSTMDFGTAIVDGGVRFRLYAPGNAAVTLLVEIDDGKRAPYEMATESDGWFETIVAGARAGTRYRFQIGETLVPDPAARFAPLGVHGPSEVVDPAAFEWPATDWDGLAWHEHVFYEIHIGTFTPQGTYAAAISKLDSLAELGITAIQLMPLAEAPGARNWGYDGVLPFAPSHNYGTPTELKTFVAAAHARGIGVYLDLVYNHFGPEANFLPSYAPQFYTEDFHTPWGAAIDVIGDEQNDVRAFFIQNTLYWLEEFRFDGIRFDAVHEIYDGPERRFLRELADTVHERTRRRVHLIVENEHNEAKLLESGFRAQWADDLHNALHVAVTGQIEGYYADFETNNIERIARALREGFDYQGEAPPSKGGATRGEPSAHLELASFVTFLQNHDQVGNRPFGDRITKATPAPAVRAAAACVLLAPAIPMLFMGEEWGASTPFLFFCDFEPDLAQKVTEGRRAEFKSFAEFSDPEQRERIPDPSAASTFEASKLEWEERETGVHAAWLTFYRELLAIRKAEVAPRVARVRGRDASSRIIGEHGIVVRWRVSAGETLQLEANLSDKVLHGFAMNAPTTVLFQTHDATIVDGVAPAWSVRWSIV